VFPRRICSLSLRTPNEAAGYRRWPCWGIGCSVMPIVGLCPRTRVCTIDVDPKELAKSTKHLVRHASRYDIQRAVLDLMYQSLKIYSLESKFHRPIPNVCCDLWPWNLLPCPGPLPRNQQHWGLPFMSLKFQPRSLLRRLGLEWRLLKHT